MEGDHIWTRKLLDKSHGGRIFHDETGGVIMRRRLFIWISLRICKEIRSSTKICNKNKLFTK